MRASALAPLALLLVAAGCRAGTDPPPTGQPARPSLALMTSLPIYWPEDTEFAALLAEGAAPGRVRRALEERFVLVPVDTLDAESLAGVPRLMLAQPRPLAPVENAALDAWVRAGGRVLMFADPLLTAHSRFPVGDKRRPQDVALLSPILRHWGLELQFDERAGGESSLVEAGGTTIPVAMAGRFRLLPGSQCQLSGNGLLAACMLGKGRAIIVADAAMLDDADGAVAEVATEALNTLLDRTFR